VRYTLTNVFSGAPILTTIELVSSGAFGPIKVNGGYQNITAIVTNAHPVTITVTVDPVHLHDSHHPTNSIVRCLQKLFQLVAYTLYNFTFMTLTRVHSTLPLTL
jgi:hypothetical protein